MSPAFLRRAVFASAVPVVLLAAPVSTQATSTELVMERAETVERFMELLDSDRPAVVEAALEGAAAGDDPTLKRLAREHALSSDDERLHSAAIREFLAERDRLGIDLILPDDPSEPQTYTYQQFGALVLEGVEFDRATDTFTVSNYRISHGEIVRGGFEFRFGVSYTRCSMHASPAGGTLLTGAITCLYSNQAASRAGGERATILLRITMS